jgi:TPR repeat protein
MSWYRRAAAACGKDDGSPSEAQFQIGDLYAYGAGVKQDKIQALTWYLIATNLGTSGLRGEYIDEMEQATTKAQQREARTRAQNYLASQRQRCGHA